MKHLRISEIALLSNIDRRARRIKFDPKRTILLGLNQTGKSSLVKSIYHALGAEPARIDQRWLNAEVKSLIKFSVDESQYALTRDGNYFSAFDGNGHFIESFTHVTDGLGPFLAKIFDFKLVLSARDQSPQTPPPAFLYLPFYVDQDASWQAPWKGFARLMQYTGWTSAVAEYHTGARDNYYYELLANVTREVSNIDYFGEPIYTYSLRQGIDDGFLAPYKVVRIDLDKDLIGWRPDKGMVDKYGNEIEDRIYNQRDFDRNLVLEKRTELVAKKVSEFLKQTNRFDKTIVFCDNIDYAERMRRALVNENGDLVAQNGKYVMRITGDNEEGKLELDNFIFPESKYPVIATTSKLMTTGVDAQTCKLIVLDQRIQSMTEFKQIIGRGTTPPIHMPFFFEAATLSRMRSPVTSRSN
jgi:hypothetical protein